MDAQQLVEGGGGINECCAVGITVLYWWLSVFLDVMQQERGTLSLARSIEELLE